MSPASVASPPEPAAIPVAVGDAMSRFANHLKVAEIALAGTLAAGIGTGDYQESIVLFLQELQDEFDEIRAHCDTAPARQAG